MCCVLHWDENGKIKIMNMKETYSEDIFYESCSFTLVI